MNSGEGQMSLSMLGLVLLAPEASAGDGGFDNTHAVFDSFLEGAVSTAGVDYAMLASRRGQLDEYLENLSAAPVEQMGKGAKLALYVNAYNACTIKLMLDNRGVSSIRDLDGGNPWDVRKCKVAGQDLTLNQMEHEKARKLTDGRVHAAVNCASKGCPPLPPDALSAGKVEAQLTAAAKTWAGHNAFSIEGSTLRLSKIFDWYADDFVAENEGDLPGLDKKAENAVWFLLDKVDEATATTLRGGELTADWLEYDWSLNAR